VRRAVVPLGELLDETASLVASMATAKGIDYGVTPCHEGVDVQGDPDRIRQIVVNLLSNAVKFTPEGGRVLLSAEADGEQVRVQVADSGPGIAGEDHERVFDAFVQLAPTADGALAQGAGLGLSISRELARAMGGDVTLSSAPGQGATFTLHLRQARKINGVQIFAPEAPLPSVPTE
jgi:signal transduction histidine kinase